jgi:hypothetical protein
MVNTRVLNGAVQTQENQMIDNARIQYGHANERQAIVKAEIDPVPQWRYVIEERLGID